MLTACAGKPQRTNPLTASEAASFRVTGIEVQTKTARYVNARAADRKTVLAGDIQAKLRSVFADRLAKKGYRLEVEVTSFRLDNSGNAAFGGAFNRLMGFARLKTNDDGKLVAEYPVEALHQRAGKGLIGALIVASADSEEDYYSSVIEKFATAIRKKTTE